MQRIKQWPSVLLFGLAIFLASGCGDDDGPGGVDFDRAGLLENYADNFIQPAFNSLAENVSTLRNQIASFDESTTESELEQAKTNWITSYTVWQSANAYNFGPAGQEGSRQGLIEEIGTFPVSTVDIEANISAAISNLEGVDRDTRGFLTLEFLLFGFNQSPQEVLAGLNNDANRRTYLLAVADDILNRLNMLNDEWNSYKSSFIAADGTDAGSSTSQLYNEFVRGFEAAKNFKVALPAGKRPGQLVPEPELVEAYYSGLSLDMLKAHLQNIEDLYFGSNSLGFTDYLQAVEGGADLVSLTEEQWAEVKAALNDVPTDRPFSQLIAEEDPSIDALHTELQRHTRFFKSDMSSLLGIAITFSSGDGD